MQEDQPKQELVQITSTREHTQLWENFHNDLLEQYHTTLTTIIKKSSTLSAEVEAVRGKVCRTLLDQMVLTDPS